MRQPYDPAFYNTAEWRTFRKHKLLSVGFHCERCDADLRSVPAEVHHVIYERFGGEERLADVEALCSRCHDEVELVKAGDKAIRAQLEIDSKIQRATELDVRADELRHEIRENLDILEREAEKKQRIGLDVFIRHLLEQEVAGRQVLGMGGLPAPSQELLEQMLERTHRARELLVEKYSPPASEAA